MRSADFLAPVLLFTAASTAWPWPSRLQSPIEAAKREIQPLLHPRAPQQASHTSFDLSFSATQGNTATTEQTSAQKTEAPSTATGSDASNTGSAKSSGQKSDGSSGQSTTGKPTGNTSGGGDSTGKSTPTSTKTFDDRLPAGGVSMITPNAMTPQYYKVKDWVTFAWNYTSLSVTPSAVDVLASCSTNLATYTIALNQSIPTGAGEQQTVLWDTGAYQATASVPLLTGEYTLIIYDAQSSVSATAQAGYLSTQDQFTFGMYLPQIYTPFADWTCTTCSDASGLERQTMGFIAGTVVITVLSFTWFAGVAGLW